MTLPLWYWITLFGSAAIIFVIQLLEDHCKYYDIHINDDFIKGCRCKFHPFKHVIEVTNPKTGRVIVIVYQYYSIDREYWKWRKNGNP